MIIKGTVAIVTGGAGGIGRAFCVALLEKGAASVVILDINKEAGEKTQEELRTKYGQDCCAQFIQCDISKKDELTSAFKKTVDEHGRLDILCNNAGIGDEVNWEKCIATNLTAVIQGTYLAFEYMKAGGVVVNTASLAAFAALGNLPVYCTTKAGVVSFTRSIGKVSLETKGIRVCCICPGMVDTPTFQKDISWLKEKIEKHGIVQPEFIAKGLLQLINDDSKGPFTWKKVVPGTRVTFLPEPTVPSVYMEKTLSLEPGSTTEVAPMRMLNGCSCLGFCPGSPRQCVYMEKDKETLSRLRG